MAKPAVAQDIVHILKGTSQDVTYRQVNGVNELNKIPAKILAHSRVISFGIPDIVPKQLLDRITFGIVNVHPGPPSLPGWSPHHFALYEELESFGVTAYFMTEKVDSGPIIAVEAFKISKSCSMPMLLAKIAQAVCQLLCTHADVLIKNTVIRPLTTTWGERKLTKAKFKALCSIPPNIKKAELLKRVRAFGSGDGISQVHLCVDQDQYLLVNDQDFFIGEAIKTLHGISFKRHGS